MQIPLKEILTTLLFKIESLEDICRNSKGYDSSNMSILSIRVDEPLIMNAIVAFPYNESKKELVKLKERIKFLSQNDVWFENLISNIFIIKDNYDLKESLSIITEELTQLDQFIDTLIAIVHKSIPPEDLLDANLKQDFFYDLVQWTDNHKQSILIVDGLKSDDEIAEQFYSIYKMKTPITQYFLNFNWEKGAIYYLLRWIATTNKKINRIAFYENPYFLIEGKNIKERSLSKGASGFETNNSDLKKLIDTYIRPYQS